MKSFFHFCKFLLKIDSPRSKVTSGELDLLLKHSQNAEIIVEIGCAEGKTSIALAQNSAGIVYTIDHFPKNRWGICYAEWIARIYARRCKVKNLKFLKGLSNKVAERFDKKIDFLFIDADHSYQAIREDWQNWFPKVRKGGMIALHDCKVAINSRYYLGSMKFYEEDIPKIKDIKEVAGVDSLVIFERT